MKKERKEEGGREKKKPPGFMSVSCHLPHHFVLFHFFYSRYYLKLSYLFSVECPYVQACCLISYCAPGPWQALSKDLLTKGQNEY